LGIKKKRKQDIFVANPALKIDYKNPKVLRRFMSERGKVLSRRMTGLTATNQRLLTVAIRRAQQLALLPIVNS
jgi:small subunit ribosomal protein S18